MLNTCVQALRTMLQNATSMLNVITMDQQQQQRR